MGYLDELSRQKGVHEIMYALDIGKNVASELYVLAGYDSELAIRCGESSYNLPMCKAKIVNERLTALERKNDAADREEHDSTDQA